MQSACLLVIAGVIVCFLKHHLLYFNEWSSFLRTTLFEHLTFLIRCIIWNHHRLITGISTIEELVAGHTNLVVCYRDSHIVTIPIDEALQMKKSLDPYMYRVAYDVSI